MKPAQSKMLPRHDSELFSVLMENVSEALFVVEPESWCFLQANKNASVLIGYSEQELFTLTADRVFSSGFDVLQKAMVEPAKPSIGAAKLLHRGGKTLNVYLSVHVVDHRGGKAILAIAQCSDRLGQIEPHGPTLETRAAKEGREDLIETTLEFPTIVGQSHQVREVCHLIGLVAKTDTTVLIQGESGTGKELIAQAIHFHSHRLRGPLIKVNCAALTESLLESELFGHKKGAFTGAIQDRKGRFKLADGGTVILDEIGSMSVSGQAKLLRVLQEREFEPVGDSGTVKVDVRVVAVTNADLIKSIDQGRFRDDLFYRLNAFPIHLPALRERKVDVPLLARHFLRKCALSLGKEINDLDEEAISILMDYSWPGNVRELANTIEYAAILETTHVLTSASLPEKLRRRDRQNPTLSARLVIAERQIILEALSGANGVKTHAAKRLGIDRRNFNYYLCKHHIRDSRLRVS
jgi:two-component system, NtrC family, response regulator AtoC